MPVQTRKTHKQPQPGRIGVEISRVFNASIQPLDSASSTFFRFAFGLIMAMWAWDYLADGRVRSLYIDPEFNFSYYGFGWVQPWGGDGMYFHFILLAVFAALIAVGAWYRVATFCFATLFTCFFLLDRTNYQNHYYLILLISWWLVLLPLNRNVAVDCLWRPQLVSQTVPRWCLWALQLHIAIPYFFGGIAKLTPDWLLGQPMGLMLSRQAEFPVIGTWLAWGPTVMLFTWFGILFDLLIVPSLMWKKTRVLAFSLALAFHLANSVLFSIHIFPWFMIIGSTLFFEPNWPRRFLTNGRCQNVVDSIQTNWSWTPRRRVGVGCACLYLTFQAVWPLRHNLYEGDASWNERGHLFAWRMMLRGKEVGVSYAVKEPRTGKVVHVNHQQFLAAEQAGKFARDPEMILHFAHFLADKFTSDVGQRPEVYAFVLTSLNGRKPQFLIDPNTNLAAEPRGIYYHRDWVLPLEEPLRDPPWDLPVSEWQKYVEMPPIRFLDKLNQPESQFSAVESGD